MRVRSLLIATAIVSAILGGFAVYLVMSVPNDLKADAMLKHARKDLEAGKREPARDELSRIVQQYPRTDAAAAAMVALLKLEEQQRKELQAELARLRKDYEQSAAASTTAMSGLQKSVEDIRNAPPKQVVVQAPAKKAPAKSPAKKTTQRRRRRR